MPGTVTGYGYQREFSPVWITIWYWVDIRQKTKIMKPFHLLSILDLQPRLAGPRVQSCRR